MANKRKCKYCLEYFPPEKIKRFGVGYFCSIEHALQWVKEKQAKDKARKIASAKKEASRQHKVDKERIKRPSETRAEAQKSVNRYIRARDYHEGCISCGKSKEEVESDQGWKVGGCWDAGHYKSRGAKGQLRFVLFNIHKQCKSCNAGSDKFSHKADTVASKYRVNLIKKIGSEKVEWLDNNNGIDHRKNDKEYHRRIKKIFDKKARLLTKRLSRQEK